MKSLLTLNISTSIFKVLIVFVTMVALSISGVIVYYFYLKDFNGGNNIILSQSRYPGCDSNDIIVGDYIIATCNVGTETASIDWIISGGNYFQWGRNKGFKYIDKQLQSIQISGDLGMNANSDKADFIGGIDLVQSNWANTNINNNWGHITDTSLARQGPCELGYHVPSAAEWLGVIQGGWGEGGSDNGPAMQSLLKLPFSGLRSWHDGNFDDEGSLGVYWSTTPIDDEGNIIYDINYEQEYDLPRFASMLLIKNNNISLRNDGAFANAASVRCFKN